MAPHVGALRLAIGTSITVGTLRDDAHGRTIAKQTLVSGLKAVRAVKRASKGKRRSKTIPVLGAAGLSLSLASGVSPASPVPSLGLITPNVTQNRELIVHEEEIFEQSLATFHVFDKERARSPRTGERPIAFGGGACCQFACLAGQAASENTYSSPVYSPPVPRPIRPPHRPVRKKR